jgi:tRNA(Arg) A34 adenosine deaminase TadA
MTFHEPFIRQCLDLAISAGKKGNQPFGALLVHQNQVILTAENTVRTDQDSTRHAELNLVVKGERALSVEVLRQSTLYTSTAPCLICAAVIWSAGISQLVYSVSYEAFAKMIPGEFKYIPCDEIYQRLGTALDLAGPILEEEGLQVFRYWPSG